MVVAVDAAYWLIGVVVAAVAIIVDTAIVVAAVVINVAVGCGYYGC